MSNRAPVHSAPTTARSDSAASTTTATTNSSSAPPKPNAFGYARCPTSTNDVDLLEQALEERRREKQQQRSNAARLQRFAAVAKEANKYACEGVTEMLLQEKQRRFSSQQQRSSPSDGGDDISCGGLIKRKPQSFRQAFSAAASTASSTTCDQDTTRSAPCSVAGRTDTASSGRSDNHQLPVHHDNNEEEEEEEGHICVVKSNFASLLFSTTSHGVSGSSTGTAAAAAATAPSAISNCVTNAMDCDKKRTILDMATLEQPAHAAGAIPLSLRGLVVSRKTPSPPPPREVQQHQLQPSQPGTTAVPTGAQIVSFTVRDVVVDPALQKRTTTSAPPPPTTTTATTSATAPSDEAAAVASRRPPARTASTSSASSGMARMRTPNWQTQPKSILKRHPIPRKHARRVHFKEETLSLLETTNSSLNGSHLRLSKDGPPVKISVRSLLDEGMDEEEEQPLQQGDGKEQLTMATVRVSPREMQRLAANAGVPSSSSSSTASLLGGSSNPRSWGADSEAFNVEWGLPSPVHKETSSLPQGGGGGVGRRSRRTNGDPSKTNSTAASAIDMRRSYHTGLSMEEARLMQAIMDVNNRLKKTGFSVYVEPHNKVDDEDDHGMLLPAKSRQGVPASSTISTTGEQHMKNDVAVEAPKRPSLLLPPPAQAAAHGGGIICGFDCTPLPTRVQAASQPPPPVARTSRNAPSATLSSHCTVVEVPPVDKDSIPDHVRAALPKRKSDHQELTRRDRFGKKMALNVPK